MKKIQKKVQKKKNNYRGIGIIAAIVVIVGLVSITIAYTGGNPKVVVEGDYIEAPQSTSSELGEVNFGGVPAASTSHITSNVQFLEQADFTATTTIQEINYGSRYFVALDFSAGNTSTPGALASIQNTGETRICHVAELNISTASLTGGHGGSGAAWAFSLSTSTSATGDGRAPTLIATTTVATSTLIVLDNTEHVGSYNASSFTWGNSVYINAKIDIPYGDVVASSTAYTSMVGGLYVTCHTQ